MTADVPIHIHQILRGIMRNERHKGSNHTNQRHLSMLEIWA